MKGVMTFQYGLQGEIHANVRPITSKKAQKVFEFADKLGAKVYKLGKEITKESVLNKSKK